jgi:N,N'-diacetyllegionaminate synthase
MQLKFVKVVHLKTPMIGHNEESTIKIEIICEIASAHEGNIESLFELLRCADRTGSDWVKLQIYQFDKLVASDNEKFADLKIIELSPKDWVKALDFAEKLQIKLIIEPFDYDSFLLVRNHPAIDAFKIPTSDLLDARFVSDVFAEGKIVFIAVGGTELKELDAIMAAAKDHKNTEIILLHGFQNFPTKLEDSLLNKIPSFIGRYNCRVGFADHIDASDQELSRVLPAMAIAAGASIIEKHLTLDRDKKSYDYYSALNPDEFDRFVQHIHCVAQALGHHDLSILSEAELSYRNNMKKFAVVSEDISAGSLLDLSKISYKRTTEPGLTHSDLSRFSHKKFRHSMQKNRTILTNDFE